MNFLERAAKIFGMNQSKDELPDFRNFHAGIPEIGRLEQSLEDDLEEYGQKLRAQVLDRVNQALADTFQQAKRDLQTNFSLFREKLAEGLKEGPEVEVKAIEGARVIGMGDMRAKAEEIKTSMRNQIGELKLVD